LRIRGDARTLELPLAVAERAKYDVDADRDCSADRPEDVQPAAISRVGSER
jgi:hypothetical protein